MEMNKYESWKLERGEGREAGDASLEKRKEKKMKLKTVEQGKDNCYLFLYHLG